MPWKPLGPEAIDALVAFLPRLESDGSSAEAAGRATSIVFTDTDGVAGELMDALYEHGAIVDFDWPSWDYGRRRATDHAWIARANLKTVCKLLTAHARQDRFCGGHFGVMCTEGHIQALLRRLAQFRQGPPTRAGRPLKPRAQRSA